MITVPTAPTDLLTPAEVAALLHVDPKTVSRWATAGKIQSFRTPGGHRRFLRSEILLMIAVDGAAKPRTDQQSVVVQTAAPVEPGWEGAGRPDRLAGGVVAGAVKHAVRIQSEHASADLIATTAAVKVAAQRTAAAARRARDVRLQAAEDAAEAIAAEAARTAADLKLRADGSARRLAEAALEAAALVASANRAGSEREDAATASRLAALVHEAAVVAAAESAEAAVRVATAVTAAAAAVASAVSVTDVSIESEVAKVAAALQFAASAQARQVAAETDARASARAMVARDAARAVRRRDLDAGTDRVLDSNQRMFGLDPNFSEVIAR